MSARAARRTRQPEGVANSHRHSNQLSREQLYRENERLLRENEELRRKVAERESQIAEHEKQIADAEMVAPPQGKKATVVNLSMYDYDLEQKIELLRVHGAEYHPDFVVFEASGRDLDPLPPIVVDL